MNKESITEAFSSKILGIRNYKSDKKEFFVKDFLDEKLLDDFLDEVNSGESDITPAGKSFLKNYFGFEKLAADILERGNLHLSSKGDLGRLSDLESQLENLEPMETRRFIEQSVGNIGENALLNEELLPPESFN